MVTITHKQGEKTIVLKSISKDIQLCISDIIWIDLFNPDKHEVDQIEKLLSLKFPSIEQTTEIEYSSRYYEKENLIHCHSKFLLKQDLHLINESVSFIIKEDLLVSIRKCNHKSFENVYQRLGSSAEIDGKGIFVNLFEEIIDLDADIIESAEKDISELSIIIAEESKADQTNLKTITLLQERIMVIRNNLIDKQRIISATLKSNHFSQTDHPESVIVLQDIASLIEHTSFNFERLGYLQNNLMGNIGIEQNKVIKIFTIVTVIIMPPTLITGVYGMNFKIMPELSWSFGYPLSLFLIVLSSVLTLLFFRFKKWL